MIFNLGSATRWGNRLIEPEGWFWRNLPSAAGGATTPTSSDTVTLTEAVASLLRASTQSDSVAVSEGTPLIALSSSDSFSTSENTPQVNQSSNDNLAASEGTPQIGQSRSDSFSTTEGTPQISQSSSDNWAASETQQVVVPITSSDSVSTTDTGTVQVTVSSSDSVTTSAGTPQIAQSSSDSVSVTENQQLVQALASSDSVAVSESTPQIGTSGSDSWTLSQGTPQISLSSSDSVAGSEGTPQVSLNSSDSMTATDAGSVSIVLTVSSSDSFSVTEDTPSIITVNLISSSDSFTTSEGTPRVGLSSADSAAYSDAAIVSASQTSGDSFSYTEGTPNISVSSTDAAAFSEAPGDVQAFTTKSDADSFSVTDQQSPIAVLLLLADSFLLSEASLTAVAVTGTDTFVLTESPESLFRALSHSDNISIVDFGSVFDVPPIPPLFFPLVAVFRTGVSRVDDMTTKSAVIERVPKTRVTAQKLITTVTGSSQATSIRDRNRRSVVEDPDGD